jgi:hypothetical protein
LTLVLCIFTDRFLDQMHEYFILLFELEPEMGKRSFNPLPKSGNKPARGGLVGHGMHIGVSKLYPLLIQGPDNRKKLQPCIRGTNSKY